MKMFIAADHAGFALKQHLLAYSGVKMTDLGTHSLESCDYPLFAQKLVNEVLNSPESHGVLICYTGIGMAMAANRYRGIRAALCFNEKMAELARRHNDANVLVLGSSVVDNETALRCLRLFFEATFEGGRHLRRLTHMENANLFQ
jgi:ribose 5-phosphate isomerase B